MTCDVCQGRKTIKVPTYRETSMADEFGDGQPPAQMDDSGSKEFGCPQCCMVPFRRVRAMKVATAYPAEVFGRMQMPIERTLAARFGEYLHREGLIRFTTSGSADLGAVADKITVTAHLGVVSRDDTRRAGAVEEVAMTAAPALPSRIRNRLKVSDRAVRWEPGLPNSWTPDEAPDEEFKEPKDALDARFAGLDIG